MTRSLILYIILLHAFTGAYAQLQQPYILNGSATQRNCNCYVLTEDVPNQSGTIWNKNLIDLRQSFNYVFEINLGCKDGPGADGIGFILQTKGTNLGATGQGLGFKGISPSLGVLVDTYQNLEENDPPWDHLAIQMNGVSDHLLPGGDLAPPVMLADGNENIEDCGWHLFRIEWNAATHTMRVSVDNNVRITINKDLVADIFGSNPMVYWGFAGSTGGSSNVQQFCAALHPSFNFNGGQIFCDGTPVTFKDNSSSFGSITRWYWDLGDGTKLTVPAPPPHLYAEAGKYAVKLVIEDNSGCISDTLRNTVTIGSYPEVKFGPQPLCLGDPLQMKDETAIKVGTAAKWSWDFGGGRTSSAQHPIAPYTAPGSYPIHLEVVSAEGCASDATQTMSVFPTPEIGGIGRNACIGQDNIFTGTNNTPAINIARWYWSIGEDTLWQKDVAYRFPAGGKYSARVHAISQDGCAAKPVNMQVGVTDINVRAGRDTLIAKGQPLQLNAQADGEDLHYQWTPAAGLDNPYISDPVAVLQKDQLFNLVVTSPEGCREEDQLFVKVYTGPEFYVPTGFTPNHDGVNDYFKVIAPGVPKLDFFKVWDRWGHLVFETSALSAPWDGTIKGDPAAAGTYVWMVQGTDYNGRLFSRRGTVTLIR
ncbi:PKD domain-containing protein [Chitinophaga barathri]|uniref:PKD domain-containing protein n=2 Tax=Chitinophaga barathri TaxID=1647451 RepID=A0A3N4MEN2_9BACT|nr:PKD domain-containing protein [Chitinophaga barathri]